jgi:hypothetical protein
MKSTSTPADSAAGDFNDFGGAINPALLKLDVDHQRERLSGLFQKHLENQSLLDHLRLERQKGICWSADIPVGEATSNGVSGSSLSGKPRLMADIQYIYLNEVSMRMSERVKVPRQVYGKTVLKRLFWFLNRRRFRLYMNYKLLAGSPLFNWPWYMNEYSCVGAVSGNPILDYLMHGAETGRNPSPFFNAERYLQKFPELREKNINPLVHFIKRGQICELAKDAAFD